MLKSIAFFTLVALAVIAVAFATVSLNFDDIQIAGIDADTHSYVVPDVPAETQTGVPLS